MIQVGRNYISSVGDFKLYAGDNNPDAPSLRHPVCVCVRAFVCVCVCVYVCDIASVVLRDLDQLFQRHIFQMLISRKW